MAHVMCAVLLAHVFHLLNLGFEVLDVRLRRLHAAHRKRTKAFARFKRDGSSRAPVGDLVGRGWNVGRSVHGCAGGLDRGRALKGGDGRERVVERRVPRFDVVRRQRRAPLRFCVVRRHHRVCVLALQTCLQQKLVRHPQGGSEQVTFPVVVAAPEQKLKHLLDAVAADVRAVLPVRSRVKATNEARGKVDPQALPCLFIIRTLVQIATRRNRTVRLVDGQQKRLHRAHDHQSVLPLIQNLKRGSTSAHERIWNVCWRIGVPLRMSSTRCKGER
mmetsp:Transcript_5150/g.17972  ORF Transcript_5150/g.17972 Transcript_5150/m.17972 type:complete len:274 (+) Transcript_5150:769-1590(+)